MALLLKSKLIQKIMFAVFSSIILVEVIILVPSYFREETRLKSVLLDDATARVESLLWAVQAGYIDRKDISLESLAKSDVVGFSYRDKTGEGHHLGVWQAVSNASSTETPIIDKDYFKVEGINSSVGEFELIGLVLKSDELRRGLRDFVLRVSGLVLIIAVFVTAVTLVVLNKSTLGPISKFKAYFRDTPDITARDASIPKDLISRNDDLGDLARALEAVRKLLVVEKAEIERLATLAGESPAPVIRLSSEGALLYANKVGRRLVEEKEREFQEVSDLCAVALKSSDTMFREIAFDGKVYSLNLVPVADAGYVNIYGQDVTFRHDAETRLGDLNQTLEERATRRTTQLKMEIAKHEETERLLALSEERFRDFASATSDYYWEMDENLRFAYFSNKFTEITGVEQSVLLGRTREETGIPNVEQAAWEDHLSALREHRPFRNFVHPRLQDDGRMVYLSISGIPYFNKDGTFAGFRGSGSDVTEQIEAQRDLLKAKELADAANSAKSQFLASMSHELRTPLNAIIGFSQVLANMTEAGKRPREAEYIQYILSSGELLLSFISQLLDLSKIEAGELRISKDKESLQELVDDSVAMIQLRAEKDGVKIVNEIGGLGDLELETDGQYVRQVLLNLLSNAVKYNDKSEGTVNVNAEILASNMLRIVVADNGPGIPEKSHGDIFEPFNRLGREGGAIEGTGLGLHLSQHLVQLLGGDLGFEPQPESGSRFWLTLPLHGVKDGIKSKQDTAVAEFV